ncbi:MAG: thioredoxin family protein [bacterium]|nr:thioredoxin family protein [bacterium]
MSKSIFAVAVLAVTLTACNQKTTKDTEAVKPQVKNIEQAVVTSFVGDYLPFKSSAVGNGEKSVIFFYASWCPACQSKDKNLSEWYGSAEFPVKTYRADYDTEDALKKKYGITMQDTFVLVDGAGEVIKKEVAPSLSVLKRLLYMNIDDVQAMNEESEESEESEEMAEGAEVASVGSYTAFTPSVIGNGKESVLFFHATWCPKCKENDSRLNDFYGSADYPRSVYKIDYDTATDLKSQFGITGQDTFILIDGNGNEIERVRFPSSDALRDLLG